MEPQRDIKLSHRILEDEHLDEKASNAVWTQSDGKEILSCRRAFLVAYSVCTLKKVVSLLRITLIYLIQRCWFVRSSLCRNSALNRKLIRVYLIDPYGTAYIPSHITSATSLSKIYYYSTLDVN